MHQEQAGNQTSDVSTKWPDMEISMRKGGLEGIGIIIFGLGWIALTIFHAVFMIREIFPTMGTNALFLPVFYAIFLIVGLGIIRSGILAFRRETLFLSGNQLIIRYRLFGSDSEKIYPLDGQSRASIKTPFIHSKGGTEKEISIKAADGKEIRVGYGLPHLLLHEKAGRINDYLAAVFGAQR